MVCVCGVCGVFGGRLFVSVVSVFVLFWCVMLVTMASFLFVTTALYIVRVFYERNVSGVSETPERRVF